MVRVFFPSMFMRLISWKPNKSPPQALLHVQPSMTKHEITEYLTKIYDVDVTKVMTANFLGNHLFSSAFICLPVIKSAPYFIPLKFFRFRQVEALLWKEKDSGSQAKELQDGAGVLR